VQEGGKPTNDKLKILKRERKLQKARWKKGLNLLALKRAVMLAIYPNRKVFSVC
jgi:hypothetical protein